MHPLEKLKRIGLGPLSVEGIPRGRYRMIEQKDAAKLLKFEKVEKDTKKRQGFNAEEEKRRHRGRRERGKADPSLRSG